MTRRRDFDGEAWNPPPTRPQEAFAWAVLVAVAAVAAYFLLGLL